MTGAWLQGLALTYRQRAAQARRIIERDAVMGYEPEPWILCSDGSRFLDLGPCAGELHTSTVDADAMRWLLDSYLDCIDAEVVDLRSLRPLDHETIVESVKKTSRLVTCEEGWAAMGVGAEVVAKVVEQAFDYLDAPPLRVCQADVPMPYAANLEALSLPSVDKIVQAAKAVCGR